MSIDGNVYVVRLIELSFSELDLDNESRICWPEIVNGQQMPLIDGAFTLYDVMNKESLVQVPETLSEFARRAQTVDDEIADHTSGGIYNASIPFILVACKCDFPSTHRHVDPAGVEKRAKALIGDITAFQTSKAQPDSQKRCVAVLLRAIVSMRNREYHLLPVSKLSLLSPKKSQVRGTSAQVGKTMQGAAYGHLPYRNRGPAHRDHGLFQLFVFGKIPRWSSRA